MDKIQNTLDEDKEFWQERMEKEMSRPQTGPFEWNYWIPIYGTAVVVGFIIGAVLRGLSK